MRHRNSLSVDVRALYNLTIIIIINFSESHLQEFCRNHMMARQAAFQQPTLSWNDDLEIITCCHRQVQRGMSPVTEYF